MTLFLSATVVCASISVGSYYWQWGLSGVIAASFAISECECRVYFQGCHGNHCICGGSDWCCRPSKTVLFLSWVNTWYVHAQTLSLSLSLSHTHTHTRTHTHTHRGVHARIQMWACIWTHTVHKHTPHTCSVVSFIYSVLHKYFCVIFPQSYKTSWYIFTMTTVVSKCCLLSRSTQMHHVFLFYALRSIGQEEAEYVGLCSVKYRKKLKGSTVCQIFASKNNCLKMIDDWLRSCK